MPLFAAAPEDALPPGFMVVHGNRLEDLRALAVSWMRRHPLAPLENEVILVQSNGISQWLKLALAEDPAQGGCGIAAALDVCLPARFLWQAYRAVLTERDGEDAVPPTSPFDKSRLTWRLMRLLPALLDEPAFAPLARFLEDDADRRKRHQLAERLADLFDQYQVYRADWLAAWSRGEDVLIDARGQVRPLPEEQRWQAILWRTLRKDVGAEGLESSRASVHQRFIEACRERDPNDRPAGLPRRVMVFGISSLPSQTLEALAAVARFSQVLLCVHNPCQHYWADIVEHKDLLRAERRRQRLKPGMPSQLDEADLHLHAQPLLAAWGKQGRDYLRLLDEFDERQAYEGLFTREAMRIDLFESHRDVADGLLQQLQEDIRDLRPLHETREAWPAVDPSLDHSLRFQVAHSPLREVEILHDQLLDAFSADPTLKPRDILVMVPDIDTYAAAVQAVFGRLDRDDPRHIPFTLSDQASRHRQPLLIALEKLLHLPELRLSVSDLLDLLEVPALRERFGIGEADLPLLTRWIEGAGIRWGLDADQRESLELPGSLTQNTWAFGLRRLLLGYAVGGNVDVDCSDTTPWHDIEPYDDIGGLEAALAGPLVELLDTLETQWRRLSEAVDVPSWCQRLRELLTACFQAADDTDTLLLTQLEQALETWQESTEEARLSERLPLSVVREHWLSQIDEANLSQRFLAGAVNVATLMPMRAIPFRQVCLLGMNDGDYPRHQIPMDFDLMGHDYRPGDRSRREDDRYLFLEALLSARERLTLSWVGRSIVDNGERPPSVLLGQLRDHLTRGWRLAGFGDAGFGETASENASQEDAGGALLEALTTEHPLQPFSPQYFLQKSPNGLFTYAHEWREVHDEAPAGTTDPTSAALTPYEQDAPLTLGQLGNFLREPVKAFFTTRLGVYLEQESMERLDHEPFALDGLEHWQLQHQLIDAQRRAVEAGEPRELAMYETLTRLERQGRLAMGGFAERMREALVEPMAPLFELYEQVREEWPTALDEPAAASLTLADWPLEDWVDELRQNEAGERCRVVLLSSSLIQARRYNWKHWLRPWVTHLVAQIAIGPMTTRLLSRAGDGHFAPLPSDEARGHLEAIVTAWQAGMASPLPLARDTAFAWLDKNGNADAMARLQAGTPEEDDLKALEAAQKAFDGDGYNSGERDRDAYLAREWRGFDALMGTHGKAFADLADALYAPLWHAVKNKDKATKKHQGGEA